MKVIDRYLSSIRLLALFASTAALLTPASPALAEGALHELGEARLQLIRERIESLSQEEITEMRTGKLRSDLRNAAQKQLGEFTCLPTCDENDAKFLAIAGTGLVTLSDPVLDVTVSAPGDATTFSVGIFDGDGGVADPTSIDNGPFFLSRWDLTGSLTTFPRDVDYEYRLFASPPGGPEVEIDLFLAADGDALDLDCSVSGANCAFPSALMPNDGWRDFSIVTGPEALTPGGNFLYRLEISQDTTDPDLDNHVNVFKVRTSAVVTLRLGNQPFSYISTVNVSEDYFDVFPFDGGFFNAQPTSYDGAWQFFFDLSVGQDRLILWDGDFDRGDASDYGFTNQDTDDPDTPGAPFLPTELFDITGDACNEAAAQNNPGELCGVGGAPSGSPADNIALLPAFDPSNTVFLTLAELAVRMPTVTGNVIFPDGRLFANDNPSGNQEWEQFLISTEITCDASPTCVPTDGNPLGIDPMDAVGQPCADACLPPMPGQVPAGVYEARVQGVDMFNLNALRLPQLLCVDAAGSPCTPLRDLLLGDTIFLDLDGNGNDNGGADPGIPGVVVELVGEDGEVITVTTTDANGHYQFPVDAGTFTVRVAEANFLVPAPIGGAVGDRVWLDIDGNGDDNSGTEPGLSNIKVVLFQDLGGLDVMVDSTITDANGNYFFSDLPPGTYFVDVSDTTVPAGLTLVSGADPSAVVTITSNEIFDTLDFGYQHVPTAGTATVGDLVWLDANNDGTRDAGEMGLGGVTVALVDNSLVDVFGNPLVMATTVTADNGLYLFTDVPPGTYQVEVTDNAGVLTSLGLTIGPDSKANPTAAFTLVAGDVILDQDFGYFAAGLSSIGDTVWFDANRNGQLDGSETGIGGVTVNLLGPLGGTRATATTAPDGTFIFDNLPDGEYSLAITDHGGALDGLHPTTTASAIDSQGVTLAGADVVGSHFGWVETPTLLGLVGTTLKAPNAHFDEQTDTLVEDNNFDYDFGYIAAGSLGDRLWFDIDGDGVQDAGEPGIPGVTVELVDSDTGITWTTTTGPDGIYVFDGLRPSDNYRVTVDDSTLPTGLDVPTFDLDDPSQPISTPHTTAVSLGVDSPGVTANRDDVDFGYQGTGSIGDRVWEDVTPDGVQADPLDEPGLDGVTVELLDGDGMVIATTVTSGDGSYLFENLPPGQTTVRVVPPAGFDPTFDLDSVLDDATTVILGLDEDRTDVDFGYRVICGLTVEKTCQVIPSPQPFDCGDAKPLDELAMRWDGGPGLPDDLLVNAWKGSVGSTLLVGMAPVSLGDELRVDGYAGSPNDVFWEIFDAGSGTKIGESNFHMSCSDDRMDGAEDCGQPAGDGKDDDAGLINAWALEGLAGNGQVLDCTPTPPAPAEACEFTGQTVDCDTLGSPDFLTWQYTGGGCAASDNQQTPDKHICTETGTGIDGSLPVTVTDKDGNSVTLNPGEEVTLSRSGSEELTLTQGSAEELDVIHVSCSQPLAALDVYGSLKLVALDGQRAGHPVTYTYTVSNNGIGLTGLTLVDDQLGPVGGPIDLPMGATVAFAVTADIAVTTVNRVDALGDAVLTDAVCMADDTVVVTVTEPCDVCEGGVTDLTFQYLGATTADLVIYDKDNIDPGKVLFQGTVHPDDLIPITRRPGQSKLASEISLWLTGALNTKLHTSCSQPIGENLIVGDFVIVEARSEENGLICPLDICNPDGSAELEIDGQTVLWPILNNGDANLAIDSIEISWPAANGDLIEVKRDGDAIHSGDFAPTSATITTAWEGDLGKRTIKAGETDTLKLKFANDAILGDYSITVAFDQGCSITASLVGPVAGGDFACSKPIDSLTMIWNGGAAAVEVTAWKGSVGSEKLSDRTLVPLGGELTVAGYAGSSNDVFWEIFDAATGLKIGESKFHLSCSDDDMNGPEDCGKAAGDGKGDSGFLEDWILEGMVDAQTVLDCTDDPRPAAGAVSSRIQQDTDDVEERGSNGTLYFDSSDLELVDDSDYQGLQQVGLRFNNLAIPQGATITSATIELETDETDSVATTLSFHGEAVDDAAPFAAVSFDLSSRTTTAASVAWSPAPWLNVDEKHLTPNLASILEEIVGRAGWTAGNSLVIIVSGSGERTAKSYNGEPDSAPLLIVSYAMP